MFEKTSSQNLQIDSLDGLRGVAILFVLFSHTSVLGPLLGVNFAGAGRYGVLLFFFLSSFLLSIPLLKKKSLLDSKIWTNYAKRRCLRIFPLMATVLTINYALNNLFHLHLYKDYSIVETLKIMSLYEAKDVFWTIYIEFRFYLLLPAMIFLFRLFKNNILFCTIITLSIISANEFIWPLKGFGLFPVDFRPYLPVFLMGNLGALYYMKKDDLRKSFSRLTYEILALSAFLLVLITIPAIWNFLTGDNVTATHFQVHYLPYGLAWLVFTYSFLNGAGFIEKILTSRTLRFIGLISFSGYLWHWFIIYAIKEFVPLLPSAQALIAFPLTFAASYLSFLVFERPFLVKRFNGGKLNQDAVPQSALP